MSERDPWLTEKEAAKELRVSVYAVRQEREAGKLGFARLRRRVFYPMSDIEAYRQSIKCPPTTFGKVPSAGAGTSPGLKEADRSAAQQAQKIIDRLERSSGRLS